jgi:ribokinase
MSRVYVFGSINMDVVAFADRRPRAGETVMGRELHLLPGGKGANQAVAARRAGAETALAGRLGDDLFGTRLLSFLQDEGIDLALTRRLPDTTSGTALIVVADADNSIVVVPGANERLDDEAVHSADMKTGDVVLAQFETPQATTLAAFAKAGGAGATTILNPAPLAELADGLLALCDIVVLNESELAGLIGEQPDGASCVEWAIEHAGRLRHRREQTIVVTVGAAGVVVCERTTAFHVAGHGVRAVDTTGAGDCFVGNLAAALSRGVTVREAAEFANRAASLCVQVVGAGVSMPSREMVDRPQHP